MRKVDEISVIDKIFIEFILDEFMAKFKFMKYCNIFKITCGLIQLKRTRLRELRWSYGLWNFCVKQNCKLRNKYRIKIRRNIGVFIFILGSNSAFNLISTSYWLIANIVQHSMVVSNTVKIVSSIWKSLVINWNIFS